MIITQINLPKNFRPTGLQHWKHAGPCALDSLWHGTIGSLASASIDKHYRIACCWMCRTIKPTGTILSYLLTDWLADWRCMRLLVSKFLLVWRSAAINWICTRCARRCPRRAHGLHDCRDFDISVQVIFDRRWSMQTSQPPLAVTQQQQQQQHRALASKRQVNLNEIHPAFAVRWPYSICACAVRFVRSLFAKSLAETYTETDKYNIITLYANTKIQKKCKIEW